MGLSPTMTLTAFMAVALAAVAATSTKIVGDPNIAVVNKNINSLVTNFSTLQNNGHDRKHRYRLQDIELGNSYSHWHSQLRRKKRSADKKKSNACRRHGFPPGIPPPDTSTTSYICVDQKGCCNFTSVQAAVHAVSESSHKRTVIWINKGRYIEKVIVPKKKKNVTFQGQGFNSTVIAWNDTANSTGGTFHSGSVQVFAPNFIAKNISFMNLAPPAKPGDVGAQAVALRIAGDRAAFWGCGFFGSQDTLHDDEGRHYFEDCYIQGSIDFIFGNGRSLYKDSVLQSTASPGAKMINGAVTAHGRSSHDENTGLVFLNCSIRGSGRVLLGRAWKPYSRVIFAHTTMSSIIAPEGWNDFNDPSRDSTVFYGEYNCSGEGADMSNRAPFVLKLNSADAEPFLDISFIDGDQWLQNFNS